MNPYNLVFRWIAIILFLTRVGWNCVYCLSPDQSSSSGLHDTSFLSTRAQPAYHIMSVDENIHNLNSYVQILEEPANTLGIHDLVHSDSLFKPLKSNPTFKASCVYWAKIRVENSTKSDLQHWIMYFGIASNIDVYVLNEGDSLISSLKTGRSVAAKLKQLENGNRVERIPLGFKPNELLQLYCRIENTNGYKPKINFSFCAEDYYTSEKYNLQRILDGLFIGFLLSLIAFNLIFFITTRDIAFLYQFIFVTSVLIFMIDIMDLICDFPFLRNHPHLFEPINFTSLIILNISYLLFVDKFIRVEALFPKWKMIIKRLIQINLLLGFGIILYYVFSLNERITDTAIAMVSTVQYVMLIILLVEFFKIKDKKSYFILIATLFLIGGVIVDGICIALGIGVPINFSKYVVLGNVSFFFFGLAYRMKLLKEEEHEAIRLKENQELKNRLYANITHEFRTPLTVIQGMAQQIESKSVQQDSSKLQQAIYLIKSNSNRLLKLVNSILDLAKLESGKMNLRLMYGDIIGFLRYTVQLFESYAGSNKIYLQFLTELGSLEMDYDKDKIQQIVSNLISNAIKFTPPGGKINFTIKKTEINQHPYMQLEVKDTGEGIAESELGSLFNRFFQAEGSKHKSRGTGLGLALVNELVRLMDGKIEVESHVNQGTLFRITLPVRSTLQAEVINKGNSLKPGESGGEDFPKYAMDHITTETEENAMHFRRSRPAMNENTNPILLVIDDNKDIVYYLSSLLENQYQIETAYNGTEGITLAQEIVPDIIISDLLMPGKDGYELCDTLKNDKRTSHIPIILLTAKSDITSKVSGLKVGADAYLSKPFDEDELQVQLENLLHQRKSLQEHYRNAIQNPLVTAEIPKPIEDAFLKKLNGIILEKLDDEDFGIYQMCRAMQMSRTQLHRKITALTGKSTSIYLRSMRLQKARKLLKNPEMNISQVAFAVGFSDPNYFTRTFTEEFGITPSSFKADR